VSKRKGKREREKSTTILPGRVLTYARAEKYLVYGARERGWTQKNVTGRRRKVNWRRIADRLYGRV